MQKAPDYTVVPSSPTRENSFVKTLDCEAPGRLNKTHKRETSGGKEQGFDSGHITGPVAPLLRRRLLVSALLYDPDILPSGSRAINQQRAAL